MKLDAVFEGGGVKGIGLVGAATVVERSGYQFENVAGTSAGAIVASLIAAGYRSEELKRILEATDYARFQDKGGIDRLPFLGPVASVLFEKGLYEGSYFEKWLRELLAAKGKRTFRDLILPEYADDPRYRYRLRVIAADLSREELLILPQDAARYGIDPDALDIARAVRMSMSIPFFFEPVRLKHRVTGEVSYIVDGGILSNFPVFLFDSDGIPEWPTFGFKLVDDPNQAPDAVRHRINGPVTLFAAMFSTMMDAHDKRYVQDSDFVRTIAVPSCGVHATDFSLSRAKVDALYRSGIGAAEKFIATWDFERYKAEFRAKAPKSRRQRLLGR